MPKHRKQARRVAETLRVASPLEPVDRDSEACVGSLEVVQGAEVDLGRYIHCDRPIVIGRDARVDLSLSDGSISRAHCSVERDSDTGDYVVVDLGSTNGTQVNGVRVAGRMPLCAGDKIFLGASVVRFALSDSFDLEYHSRVEEMVSTDPLTGLGTKRQYDAVFELLADRALAEDSSLTVMMMDLDGLKLINDSHGHEMGSFAIAEAAGIARDVLEEHGHLARFGGDEFMACFPGIDESRGLALAEDLRRRIAEHTMQRDGIAVRTTISIGVATYPSQVREPGALFTAADQALYRAKRAGKNRVEPA